MALRKITSGMRCHLHRMSIVSALQYRNNATQNEDFDTSQSRSEDAQQYTLENDFKNREPEGLNEIFLTGSLSSSVQAISQGKGSAFYIEIPQHNRYGSIFRVRTRVVAYGNSLSDEVRNGLQIGSRVLIKGRLGSKADHIDEGGLRNYVVAKSISLI